MWVKPLAALAHAPSAELTLVHNVERNDVLGEISRVLCRRPGSRRNDNDPSSPFSACESASPPCLRTSLMRSGRKRGKTLLEQATTSCPSDGACSSLSTRRKRSTGRTSSGRSGIVARNHGSAVGTSRSGWVALRR